MHDLVDQLLVGGVHFEGYQRADGEGADGVGDGEGTFRAVFAACERKHVRAALALRVNVHAAYLVYQRVDE